MALLQDWREYAYGVDINSKAGQAIWGKYFNEEKAVYEQLLAKPARRTDIDVKTQVSLDIDLEQLYYHMVEAKADWLYELPAWDEHRTPERRKELYLEQKKSGTIVKEKKVGRNDPCPCGSGKKYKFCCGRA